MKFSVFTPPLFLVSALILSPGFSSACSQSTSSCTSDVDGEVCSTVNYCAEEELSYGVYKNFGSAEISGDFTFSTYVQPSDPACIYVMLSTDNATASVNIPGVNIPDSESELQIATNTDPLSTGWCQFIANVALKCTLVSTSFGFDVDGWSATTSLDIQATLDEGGPGIEFGWQQKASETTCGITESASWAVDFPVGDPESMVEESVLSSAYQAVDCAPPS